ncbi:MAG: hypothetical protein U0228_09590 [Myxococcaceae bacterium]
MTRVVLLTALALCACATQRPMMADSSGNSANSSGQSGNSSGQSGASSGQSGGSSAGSAQSSNGSAASSNGSAASSNGSNQSSGSSANSNQSSNQSAANSSQNSGSSQATTQSSQNSWSQVAVGSALLSVAGGAITTIVYSLKWRREARLAQEELRRLQQGPAPQTAPAPSPAPSPAPAPGNDFTPTPFPKKTSLDGPPSLEAMIQARSWLLANELQLQQDLALGAGPTLDDLAGLAGIAPPHRAHFARLLRAERAKFRVGPEVTPELAAAVFSRIGDVVMTDPVLRADGLALLSLSGSR